MDSSENFVVSKIATEVFVFFFFNLLILQRKFYDLRLVIDEKRGLSSWRALEIIFGGTPFRNS